MSNNNNNLQTQTSSAQHNAIMEAGGKDRPLMLAPEETKKWIDAKAEAIQIVLTGIDNDIYSIVDACPNVMEIWKAIERKFTSRDDETLDSYYLRFYKMMNELIRNQCEVTKHQNEDNEIRAERLARTANPLVLVAQQQPVYYPQPNPTHYTQSSSTRSQAASSNKGKTIANSPPPTYNSKPKIVVDDEASSKEKEIDKLVALISMSFKKIYKPTNNNLC
ncbi:hypothetical protein Tco_0314025 [Tanacetum coccineum]